ncbi:O-antigen ligase family protein [Patescibacteria group bacterium]|nr:O-antigen ligase family protein [Patescibacteria group bacterium]
MLSTHKLKQIIQVLIYVSLATPLIFLPQFFMFPFIVPKALFFRSVMVLAGTLSMILYLYMRRTRKERIISWTPLSIFVAFYAGSLIISTIFALDPHFALWNNHERMLGVFTILHYVVLFYVGRYVFTDWKSWRNLLALFLGIGMLTVVVSIIQRFVDPEFFYNRGAKEVISTLGNPIYFAGFSLFMVFFGGLFMTHEKSWLRWYGLGVFVFGFVGVGISNTRGTILGLMVALVLVGLLYFIFYWKNRRLRNIIIGLFIILFVLISFAFVFRNITAVRKLPIVGDIVTVSPFEHTAKTRLMAWDIAWQAWKDRPVFGWGPNNYYFAFNTYFNPDFLEFGYQETWFDNAHSVFMNTLATQGLFGFLIYICLFCSALWSLYRSYCKDNEYKHIVIWTTGFLIGHMIHNIFVFENLTSYLYFFLVLGFIDVTYLHKTNKILPEYNVQKNNILLPWVMVATIFGIGVVFLTNVNVAVANYNNFHMRGLLIVAGKVDESIDRLNKAISWYSPHQGEIDWDFAAGVLDTMPRIYYSSPVTARKAYDLAVERMQIYINLHPKDVRARLVYSDLLRGGVVLFDLSLGSEIEEQLKVAEDLSPNRQEIELARITYFIGTEQNDKAIEKAEEIIASNPEREDGYIALGQVYYFLQEYYKIPQILDSAIMAGVRFSTVDRQFFAAQAYEREGRFQDALYWYNQAFLFSRREDIAVKRDELSNLTKKDVPQSLEEFFEFDREEVVTTTEE